MSQILEGVQRPAGNAAGPHKEPDFVLRVLAGRHPRTVDNQRAIRHHEDGSHDTIWSPDGWAHR